MSLAVIKSRALDGLAAPAVQVEVHLANGLPSFTLVGLADTEVKEARERVRAALANSGFAFPHNKRITVNLAPADLPKESGRFDLPIALGILAADGQLDAVRLAQCEFAGELSLAGELRPVRGALALALALQRDDPQRTLVLQKLRAHGVCACAVQRTCCVWCAPCWLVMPPSRCSPCNRQQSCQVRSGLICATCVARPPPSGHWRWRRPGGIRC